MRAVVLLPILILSTLAECQDLSRHITYSARATALQTTLKQLSKQAGVELQCSQDLANEPIILRLNDVPTKEVMDKIAEVTAGEWIKLPKAIELRRSDLAQKRHLAAIQSRVDAMR